MNMALTGFYGHNAPSFSGSDLVLGMARNLLKRFIVALTWITNPITMPFFFFITYQMGRLVLQLDPITLTEPQLSWDWLANEFGHLWKPLAAGSIITGLLLGTLGYFLMQLYWRWHVGHNWEKRKKKRAEQKAEANQ